MIRRGNKANSGRAKVGGAPAPTARTEDSEEKLKVGRMRKPSFYCAIIPVFIASSSCCTHLTYNERIDTLIMGEIIEFHDKMDRWPKDVEDFRSHVTPDSRLENMNVERLEVRIGNDGNATLIKYRVRQPGACNAFNGEWRR